MDEQTSVVIKTLHIYIEALEKNISLKNAELLKLQSSNTFAIRSANEANARNEMAIQEV